MAIFCPTKDEFLESAVKSKSKWKWNGLFCTACRCHPKSKRVLQTYKTAPTCVGFFWKQMRENEFENLVIPPDIHALKQPDDQKGMRSGAGHIR